MSRCIACGVPVRSADGGVLRRYKRVGGWKFCERHRVGIKPSRYDGRCTECLGAFRVGDKIVMTKSGDHWVLLHPSGVCRSGSPVARGDGSPFAALFLLPSAPAGVIKAAYKALALMYHPDRGSEDDVLERTQKMAAINAAVEKISSSA